MREAEFRALVVEEFLALIEAPRVERTRKHPLETVPIPALLDLLDITNSLVTIDAAGTQTNIASKIVSKGGDYMLAVKGNQPSLQTKVTEHFQRENLSVGEHKTEKHAHGRDELREAWVSFDVESIPSADRWAGLAALVRIRSTRTLKQVTSVEERYFICSRRVSAIEALDAGRGHWSIENELHWVLDVAFRENDSRVRAGNAAANFSAVRQLALGLLKQREQAQDLVNPPMTFDQLLERLARVVPELVAIVRAHVAA